MDNCPYCLTALPAGHPGLIAALLQERADWDNFESDHDRWGHPVGKVVEMLDIGPVEVIAKKTGYGDLANSYGELPQGTEYETYVILKVGENYFRKVGTGNSYGDVTWDGPVRPVTPIEKTVTAYDFI